MKEKTHLGNRLLSVLLTFLMLLSLLPSAAAGGGHPADRPDGGDAERIPHRTGVMSPITPATPVKDVLKKSSHTFSGIDSGYITAVDGTTDNFSIHYDEDGYKLDQSADGLTAIWFTTNSSQSHGANLQKLAANMAVYNTATNGLRDYKAAQEAYDAAREGLLCRHGHHGQDPERCAVQRHRQARQVPGGQDHAADHQRHHGRRGHHPRRGGVHQ